MTLDISFDTNDMSMRAYFNENGQPIKVDFGEVQIINDVSVKIEDDIAYINY